MTKREIQDIFQTVVVLSTKVKVTNKTDWEKLVGIIKYLNLNGKGNFTLL